MPAEALLLVIALGAVNWIATELLVSSAIFRAPRCALQRLGKKIRGDDSSTLRKTAGDLLNYFVTCALCVGVWIGFIEAGVFSGPLISPGFWAWSNWIANGLLYKAFGHILLQINGLLHEKVCWYKNQNERLAKEQPKSQNGADKSSLTPPSKVLLDTN